MPCKPLLTSGPFCCVTLYSHDWAFVGSDRIAMGASGSGCIVFAWKPMTLWSSIAVEVAVMSTDDRPKARDASVPAGLPRALVRRPITRTALIDVRNVLVGSFRFWAWMNTFV